MDGGRGDPHQRAVERLFDRDADVWEQYYRASTLLGVIYRDRQRAALDWLDGLGLERGARVLDLGCGAGELTAALSERGYVVNAVDSSPEMIERVSRRALPGVESFVADAYALPFEDEAYACVTALGVLPWLRDPERALGEICRVLKMGGHAIVTVDNAKRVTFLLDPRMTPLVQPVKRTLRRWLRRPSLHALDTPRDLELRASAVGLKPLQRRTVGFGPFTFVGFPVLRERRAIDLHRRLQTLADGGNRAIGGGGSHYLVLVRKAPLDNLAHPD